MKKAQKSRIQWLKLGDDNTKFFFRAMKERLVRKNIGVLFDSQGNKLTDPQLIEQEIRLFYTNLWSKAALIGVDLEMMRRGPMQDHDTAMQSAYQ